MKKNNLFYSDFIAKLISFSPRQGKGETETLKFILESLSKNNVAYKLEQFKTNIPEIKSASLLVDGQKIKCLGSCFFSGDIKGKNTLISSLTSSQKFLYEANINFNPQCEVISQSNFYFAPSVAIAKADLATLLEANDVSGKVIVNKVKHTSANILVGNRFNPRNIIIAHYDCIATGGTDNASGVAVIFKTLIDKPELLRQNLFVFSGNEELSYDRPIYWGHGFRVFEKKHLDIMKKANKIIVVDCVGNDKTEVSQDEKIIPLAFPIANIKSLRKNIFTLYGDIDRLMTVYHSEADTIDQLSEKYLIDAERKLIEIIQIK